MGGPEKNYCGDGNQEWTLESDGTFSVPTPPQSMCPAIMTCDKAPSGAGCGKVCLVTAAAPAAKAPDTVNRAGTCIETGGSLAWQFVALVLGGGSLYLCCGIAYGKRQQPSRHWREALPHREFWANSAGLVLDGVRYTTGKSIVIGGSGYETIPVPRMDRRIPPTTAPPPPPAGPTSTPMTSQRDEDRWEVEGARRRNKEMKRKGGGDGTRAKGGGKRDKKDKKKEKSASKKEKRDKHSSNTETDASSAAEGSDASADNTTTQERLLQEQRDERVHSSQAKIKVVGING